MEPLRQVRIVGGTPTTAKIGPVLVGAVDSAEASVGVVVTDTLVGVDIQEVTQINSGAPRTATRVDIKEVIKDKADTGVNQEVHLPRDRTIRAVKFSSPTCRGRRRGRI